MKIFSLLAPIVVVVLHGVAVCGQDGDSAPLPNLATPTLGGTQLWSDELVLRGWRIQRNFVTGHFRLLDAANVRQAWGTYEQCARQFELLRAEKKLAPHRGSVVVLLHGLGATRGTMEGLGTFLETEGKFEVVNVTYASTRAELSRHAASLAKVIDGLRDATEIHFVAHSLGNMVLRQYLTDPQRPGQPRPIDPRIRRIVMLGPPNQGAQWGARFKDLLIFEPVVGKSAAQVSDLNVDLNKLLATPTVEFGIVAGAQGNGRGLNPLIGGDDDLIIGLEETKLAGARDFLTVPVVHRWLMDDAKVRECTVRFLQHGYFVSATARRPIDAN